MSSFNCYIYFSDHDLSAGKKGGHKGRMRTYTSPEEIDAQMKAEKEKRRVSVGKN